MCSGAVLLYRISKVVIGENRTFCGPEEYLKSQGVELIVVDDQECHELMQTFVTNNPDLWREDIGV
jgi:cytosine deaminase